MSFLIGLAIGAVVAAVSAGTAFIFNKLSEREERKQEEMRAEYRKYEARKEREVRKEHEFYEQKNKELEESLTAWDAAAKTVIGGYSSGNDPYRRLQAQVKHNLEVAEFKRAQEERKKKGNRSAYEKFCKILAKQRRDKERLMKFSASVAEAARSQQDKMKNTFLRTKSIAKSIRLMEECCAKCIAYLAYLDRYSEELRRSYEASGDLVEPFSMSLPDDYPYEGKIYELPKNAFKGYAIHIPYYGPLAVFIHDRQLFDNASPNARLTFMAAFETVRGKMSLSLSYGLLVASVGGSLGIEAEVKNVKPNAVILKFNGFRTLILPKKNMINPLRSTPIGSALRVFVSEYNYAMKGTVTVSQKAEDGYTIESFESIILTVDDREQFNELKQEVQKQGLENVAPEWRIAPIMDNGDNLKGLVLQYGCYISINTRFDHIAGDEERIILAYDGLRKQKDYLSFDEVFVNAEVEILTAVRSDIEENVSRYKSYFENCANLELYLQAEFVAQQRLAQNSAMKLYLGQWEEITKRLIDYKSLGNSVGVIVEEVSYTNIATLLYPENDEEISQFFKSEMEALPWQKFFLLVEGKRVPCEIALEDDEVKLTVEYEITRNCLIKNEFRFDLYSTGVTYVEKLQLNAFSKFKEGRIVNPELKDIILNVEDSEFEDTGNRIEKLFNPRIAGNANQLSAVERALADKNFFMIQGPPGTGKTTVIKELILQQLAMEPRSRILVVSQANVAVDNVLRGIIEASKDADLSCVLDESQIIRCGTPDKIADDVDPYAFSERYKKYVEQLKTSTVSDPATKALREKWLKLLEESDSADAVSDSFLNCYQIIGATCVGLENRRYGLGGIEFDLVVIDEAGKALPGELLIPLNRAKKAVIIGDHKQLPPVIDAVLYRNGGVDYDDVVERDEQEGFLNSSFFERMYGGCPDNLKRMLDIQFRMPNVIADLVNIFYDGKISSGANCSKKKPMILGSHLILVDMKGDPDYKEMQEYYSGGIKSGPYNPKEAKAVVCIAKRLREYYTRRLVVITPYKRQKKEIINALEEKGIEDVWVNTIDAFQGDEEDIVIYCTTRSQKQTPYFSDSARLNVAFSRARNTLIMIASSDYIGSYPEGSRMAQISSFLKEKAKKTELADWQSPGFDLMFDGTDLGCTEKEVGAGTEAKAQMETAARSMPKRMPVKHIEQEKEDKEIRTCLGCGERLSDKEEYLCSECMQNERNKDLVCQEKECILCGKTFGIAIGEKEFMDKMNYKLPNRCPECRKRRKLEAAARLGRVQKDNGGHTA